MWVRMIKTAAGPGGVFQAGDVVEIKDEATAKRWIGGGYAAAVDGPGGAPVEAAVVEPGAEVADAPAARRAKPRKPATKPGKAKAK